MNIGGQEMINKTVVSGLDLIEALNGLANAKRVLNVHKKMGKTEFIVHDVKTYTVRCKGLITDLEKAIADVDAC